MPPGTIFISYRRDDSRADAGRLYDRLQARYPGRIFRDVGSIEPGADWTHAIEETLRTTDACLVVIGPEWLTLTDEDGRRRIDDPQDAVRKEIATALTTGRIRVFPVLVGGARMPDDDDLPADLKALSRRNALSLSEQDFDAGVEKLVKALQRMPGWESSTGIRTRRASLAGAAAIAAAIVVIAALYFYRDGPDPDVSGAAAAGAAADTPAEATIALPSTGLSEASSGGNTTAGDSGTPAAPTITETASAAGTVSLGQITLEWPGVSGTSWQVYDERGKTVLRYATASAGASATVDIGAGRYMVVLDQNTELPAMPVSVSGGRAVVIKPPIGQLTLEWPGVAGTSWQVYDEAKKKILRYATVGAATSATLDIAPGRYVVVLDRLPEVAPIPIAVSADKAVTTTTAVGQITFAWDGANAVAWQVADASGRTTLRYLTGTAGQSSTTDIAPGQYQVVLGSNPEAKPIPVTVTAGKASMVTSPVGQITFEWGGVNAVTWQVNSGATMLRYASTGGGQRTTLDIAPGSYQVVLPGSPEIKPMPVTVTAGKESRVGVK